MDIVKHRFDIVSTSLNSFALDISLVLRESWGISGYPSRSRACGVEKFSTPSASGLSARAVAVVCCQVPLEKVEKTATALFLQPSQLFRLVKKAYFVSCCGRDRISRRSESAPEYFGISNLEIPVFDRRAMEADRPSQEGREDVPSELSFLVSAPEADPTPVVTRPSEGTRIRPQLWSLA